MATSWPSRRRNLDGAHAFVATVSASSCLGSQYAGWSLSFVQNDDNFSALGSGPCRALAGKEDIFKDIGYEDKFFSTVVVLEVDQKPPQEIIDKIVSDCNISEKNLWK